MSAELEQEVPTCLRRGACLKMGARMEASNELLHNHRRCEHVEKRV
jgi:hypothetical protein